MRRSIHLINDHPRALLHVYSRLQVALTSIQTMCDAFGHCPVDLRATISQASGTVFVFSPKTAQMSVCLPDTSPVAATVFITAGSGAHNVSFVCVLTCGCVVCVQPPPSRPGVAGSSLPGGAPVPRFTPVLLQRREQAERVLTKSVSAIIIFALGGRRLCLLIKTT